MKKWMGVCLSCVIFFSGMTISTAKQDSGLHVFLERPIAGELTAFRFLIDHLPFVLENEFVEISFPPSYVLPEILEKTHFLITKNKAVESVALVNENTLLLKADLSGLEKVEISISQEAAIANPVSLSDSLIFAVVFQRMNFVSLSRSIILRSPNNTVKLSYSPAILADDSWITSPFHLEMSSSFSKDIRFSINNQKEQDYLKPLLIDDGIHRIRYYGLRSSGASENFLEKVFKVDTQSPHVRVLSPTNNLLTNKKTLELVFQIRDVSPVRLILEEFGEYLVPDHGKLKVQVELKPGQNKIVYEAFDAAMHSTKGVFLAVLDITPPYLEVFSPTNQEIICTSRVEVTGKAEADSKVWVGDHEVKLDRFGNFSFLWQSSDGLNQLVVRAVDLAGNESRKEVTFWVYSGILVQSRIGQSNATVNGENVTIQPPPFIDRSSGEIYFPLRFLSDTLDFELVWVPQGSYASMKKDSLEIRVRSLDNIVQIRSGKLINDVRLQFPPTVHQGSMMVSAEFIKRILGGDLIIDADKGQIIIHFCLKTIS